MSLALRPALPHVDPVYRYLDETAESLVHGLCQGIEKYGLPRALMTDNGPAMMAAEVREGLARLGVLHQPTLPYSPEQNAKQEVLWGTVEGRLMAMLEGCENLTLGTLNEATCAWLDRDYHRREHRELGTSPRARFQAAKDVGREGPSSAELRAAFRTQVRRRPRRSDGTVSLAGARFELPSRYRHLSEVAVRYARWVSRPWTWWTRTPASSSARSIRWTRPTTLRDSAAGSRNLISLRRRSSPVWRRS